MFLFWDKFLIEIWWFLIDICHNTNLKQQTIYIYMYVIFTLIWGLPNWQVKDQAARNFSAMCKEEYGGTVPLRKYLETGQIHDRKITRPALHAAKPLPVKRRRLEKLSARQHKRDRYYGNVVQKLGHGESVPAQSPRVHFHVDKRMQASSSKKWWGFTWARPAAFPRQASVSIRFVFHCCIYFARPPAFQRKRETTLVHNVAKTLGYHFGKTAT